MVLPDAAPRVFPEVVSTAEFAEPLFPAPWSAEKAPPVSKPAAPIPPSNDPPKKARRSISPVDFFRPIIPNSLRPNFVNQRNPDSRAIFACSQKPSQGVICQIGRAHV